MTGLLSLRLSSLRFATFTTRAEQAPIAVGVLAYLALLATYLCSPVFADHLEPSVGAIASALLRGQPPYHGMTGAESYELPYGPHVFGVHALAFSIFGRSILALKLSGIMASAAGCALTFDVLRRRVSLRCACGGLLVLIAYLAYYDARAYWCRPEPFLFAGAALAVWLARAHPGGRGELAFHAALVLWMVGLKSTGLLYVAPVLALLAARRGARAAIAVAAIGVALAVAELAIPPLSLTSYFDVLAKTARHGLSWSELLANLFAAAILVGPALGLRLLRPAGPPVPPARAPWRVPLIPLVLCVAVTCVIAAKPGAGRHHLLPFLPLCLDALIDGVDGIERGRVARKQARLVTLLLRVGLASLVVTLVGTSYAWTAERDAHAEAASRELASILAAHRDDDLQMGYADGATYEDTFARVLVAFDHPLRVDASSQMDSTAAGHSASEMLGRTLEVCSPRVWILPHGDPFSMLSFYKARGAPDRVFDMRFAEAFIARYELVEEHAFYRVYECRQSPLPAAK